VLKLQVHKVWGLLAIVAGTACSSSGTPGAGDGTKPGGPSGGSVVTATEVVPAELVQSLEAATALDGPGLREAYPLELDTTLGYDPLDATGLDLLQGSALALSPAELDRLATNGFVISGSKQFPSFPYGYQTIYAEDLPLYVSADSVLFAVHRSFDEVLKQVEVTYLKPELDKLLSGMRSRLAGSSIEPSLRADLDLYLTLAASLLSGSPKPPVAGASESEVRAIYELAVAGKGHLPVTWFGSERDEDFSQFAPRGHYTDSPELKLYFRAMMLLGRVDLRLVETQGNGAQVFHRQHFDAAVALNDLLGSERASWSGIDRVVGWFAGERDSMSPNELGGFLEALGATDLASTSALADQTIIDELARGGWGAQRIASRIIYKDLDAKGTLPLDRSFALFGQRYTVDSHVFVNTTYDRVDGRMMPDPLDVGFAALGNDSALELLSPELADNASYAAGLAKTRTLVDAHEPAYWEGSLYTSWLSALRALSPSEAALAEQPAVSRTRAGQNRILNTQLASWAELRHDTILYVKQSYTTGNSCEFPDAYVDPYPELYQRLGLFADRMGQIAEFLPVNGDGSARSRLDDWVTNFKTVMGYLERMAENQKSGTPHDQELMDFINQAVTWKQENVCGQVFFNQLSGWYFRLFFDPGQSLEADPTIADVHTQPTDEGGNDVGRILHVGTGNARLLVTTIETCNGPRAYVGLASSFGQTVEENWTRLTDPEWALRIAQQPYPDPPWMSGILVKP
jgi:hypothetical protein